MINFINSLTDLWDRLRLADKPIVLYGMGNGADKILDELESRNIAVKGIFASDDFVRNKVFRGFQVKKYSDLKAEFKDMIVLVSFGTSRKEILKRIYNIAREQELYAPDVAVIGGGLFDKQYAINHIEDIEKVYSMLSDDMSRHTFKKHIAYKITGDVFHLMACEIYNNPIESSISPTFFNSDETFMDIGAYTGDTVLKFIENVNGSYRHIYAIEPDRKNYEKALINTEEFENITALNLCISDKAEKIHFDMKKGRNSSIGNNGQLIDANSVDNILQGKIATYIKFDVEGQEQKAIIGAKNTIIEHKPKLKIAAYHRFDDLITIPILLSTIRNDYKIYLRHTPQIPAWDTDYYFV